jgi:hypothetical protein
MYVKKSAEIARKTLRPKQITGFVRFSPNKPRANVAKPKYARCCSLFGFSSVFLLKKMFYILGAYRQNPFSLNKGPARLASLLGLGCFLTKFAPSEPLAQTYIQ